MTMAEQTKVELVDAVERACHLEGEEQGWDFPLAIERLVELADELREAVELGEADAAGMVQLRLGEDDHALLAGLAQVLTEAIS